jgi:Ras-related protein Rab-11A
MEKDSYDLLFKLILIGDSSVGKSNILLKYLKNEFEPNSQATVGVEFGTKNILINDKRIKIQIWDTAGEERYRSITSAYYKGAKGAFIVYDITRKNTFDNIDKWISDLKLNGDQNICIIILGNKSDLNDQREVSKDEAMKKAELHKTAFLETSAYNGDNIVKAFDELIEEIYKNNKSFIEDSNKKEIDKGVNLNDNKDKDNKKCCGSS